MTGLLNWQTGQHRHIGDLNGFSCTYWRKPRGLRGWPPKGDSHAGWWEHEVQQKLRDLKPPAGPGRIIRLGYDADGLAAVSVAQELDGPADVEWEYGAIALRLRRKGGGYADEMCRDLLDILIARGVQAGLGAIRVSGYVQEANRASQEMCRRHGFVHTAKADEGVQVWQRTLLLPSPIP